MLAERANGYGFGVSERQATDWSPVEEHDDVEAEDVRRVLAMTDRLFALFGVASLVVIGAIILDEA